MKISEVTQEIILNQLREDASALSDDELAFINSLKGIAISYIKEQTAIHGVDEADENGRKLDDYENLTYAYLALISHMYDNRQMTIDKDKLNPVVVNALAMHSFALVS